LGGLPQQKRSVSGELLRGFQKGSPGVLVKLARQRELEIGWNDVAPAALPGVFDVVGTPASVIHLRMQEIDFATKRADRTHVGSLLLERVETAPPFGNETREHGADDLVTRSEVLCIGAWKP
jgi:hypothetical protein